MAVPAAARIRQDRTKKTLTLPNTNLQASNIILGLMRITSLTDDEIRALVTAAPDAGIKFFDHADVYGAEPHGCERRFGNAMTFSSAKRESITIQSKVGIRTGFFDFSKAHILRSVDESSSIDHHPCTGDRRRRGRLHGCAIQLLISSYV